MKKSWRNVVGLGARAAMIALAVTGMAASCVGGTGGGDESDPVDPPGPVDGDPTKWNPNGETGECNVDALLKAPSYASKVKALLTGMPLEAEELDAVVADPDALPGLIDGWLETDGARQMFERFFMTAFQ
ncbi:MAG: hypothetical protein KC731_41390, partial [Myxococcales bacterium]|nr:hypothetical protein [Myxococcales bacterium]